MSIYNVNGDIIPTGGRSMPNVVVLGDSICTYPDTLTYGEWIYWMYDYVNFESLKTYGEGGARWYTSGLTGKTMYGQFLTLKSEVDGGRVAPDVIVIDAGINDVASSSPIGTADEAFDGSDIVSQGASAVNTMYKAVRFTCESIRQEYPRAQIIIVTPYQSGLMARETAVQNVRDCLVESSKRLSLRVINQTDDLGIYNYYESQTPLYLRSDGTHPSEAGKALLARFVANELLKVVIPLSS